MLRIALTGGAASGKSTVAAMFADRDIPVIHTDELARKVVRPGTPGLAQLVDVFGRDILDANGELDRGRMRNQAFSDAGSRRQLEEILHPLIREEMDRLVRQQPPGTAYVIIEIPLLAESGSAKDYDRVLLVDCDEQVQLERLVRRDGVGTDAARRVIEAQASRKDRQALADDIIDNTHLETGELAAEVDQLDRKYRELAD